MWLECEWHHVWMRWSWEFEDFEKGSFVRLTLDHIGRQLGCLSQWQTVEVEFWPWCSEFGVRPWCWEGELRPWCWEVGVQPGSWDYEVGPWKMIVEFLPLGHRVGFWPLKDVVSIEWLRKTFKNCVSLLVLKNRTQKLIIKCSYLNKRVRLCFCICICTVVIDIIMIIAIYFFLDEAWDFLNNSYRWCFEYDSKLHLVVRVLFWTSGVCGVITLLLWFFGLVWFLCLMAYQPL